MDSTHKCEIREYSTMDELSTASARSRDPEQETVDADTDVAPGGR
jgi:hypothetical protein